MYSVRMIVFYKEPNFFILSLFLILKKHPNHRGVFLHFCQIILFYACARNVMRTLNIGLHYEVFCFAYYKKQNIQTKKPQNRGIYVYLFIGFATF